VYQIRWQGQKREREMIRANRSLGDLRLDYRVWDPRPTGRIMVASLLMPDGETYVLPVLDRARVIKIHRNGLLITGTEVIPRGIGIKNVKADRYPQTWWCIPYQPEPTDPHTTAARAFGQDYLVENPTR